MEKFSLLTPDDLDTPFLFQTDRPTSELETLSSYLYRLGKLAGYVEDVWFLDILPVDKWLRRPDYYKSEEVFEILSKVTRLSINDLWRMTMHRFVPVFYTPEELEKLKVEEWKEFSFPLWESGTRLAFANSSVNSPKFCPLCLKENESYLLPWNIRLVTTCLFHKVLLVEKCPNCGKPARPIGKQCKSCGFDLSKTEPTPIVDNVSLTMAEWIWSAVGCSQNPFPFQSLPHFQGKPIFNSTAQFFNYLYDMGSILIYHDPDNPALHGFSVQNYQRPSKNFNLRWLELPAFHKVLKASISTLLNWPFGLRDIFERISKLEANSFRKNRESQYTSFPFRLNQSFISNSYEWLWSEWVNFVFNTMETIEHNYAWIEYLSRLPKEITGGRVILSTKNKIARMIGVHPKTFMGMEARGEINLIKTRGMQNDEEKVFIDLANVYKIKQVISEILTEKDAAKYLGIHKRLLKELIKCGELQPYNILYVREKIKKGDLDLIWNSVLEKLEIKDQNLVERDDIVSFTEFFHRTNSIGIGFVDLITMLREGKIKGYLIPGGQGFSSIWFLLSDINELRWKTKYPNGKSSYSIYEVLKVIKVGMETAVTYCRSGLINPINANETEDFKKWFFNIEDIDKFKAKYIMTGEAAHIIGISSGYLGEWVSKGAIQAVSGRHIDGSWYYRFDKDYIVNWRSNRLKRSEALVLSGVSESTFIKWVKEGILKPIPELGELRGQWYFREDVMIAIELHRKESSLIKEPQKEIITLDQASKIIRYDWRTLRTFVEKGVLEAKISLLPNGQVKYELDKEYVMNWKYERMRSREVKDFLGIDRVQFEKLVYEGTLIPIPEMGRRPLWFYRKNVLAVKSTFLYNFIDGEV